MSDARAGAMCPPGTDTFERQNANSRANAYVPTQAELDTFRATKDSNLQTPGQATYYGQFVTGACAGQRAQPTTDFLIDCTAYKWGIPADWLRAQFVQESGWRQAWLGDRTTVSAAWYSQYPPQAQIPGTSDVYESMGISQVMWQADGSVGAGTEPLRWKSTAFAMDDCAAYIRFNYDNPQGLRSDWGDAGYQPQLQWLSLASWYEPYPWNNSGQQSYVTLVQNHLANRDWLAYNGS